MIQYYHFNVDLNQLLCHEQCLLDSIMNDFQYVYPKELLAKIAPIHNVDHKVDLISSVAPMSIIPSYQLSQVEKDEIATRLTIIEG